MLAAKSVREWVAFYGGEELGVSVDVASIIWEAATKAAEERFTSHNKQSTPLKCDHCGKLDSPSGAVVSTPSCFACYERAHL